MEMDVTCKTETPRSPSPNECAVCLEYIQEEVDGDFYTLDCCEKKIHILCMEQWLHQKQKENRPTTCPMCRSPNFDTTETNDPPPVVELPPAAHAVVDVQEHNEGRTALLNRSTTSSDSYVPCPSYVDDDDDDDEDEDDDDCACPRSIQVGACLGVTAAGIFIFIVAINL